MRLPQSVFAIVALVGLSSIALPVRAADTPTGKMEPFAYLLGTAWNCTTSVPAMGDQPAHTDQGTATFDLVPGNVIHNHVATPRYSGDFYSGYNDRAGGYWQVDADNMGGHAFLTSSDGITYSGTSSMGPLSMQDTVTYAKLSPSKVTVHEVIAGQGPGQSGVFDSVCTR